MKTDVSENYIDFYVNFDSAKFGTKPGTPKCRPTTEHMPLRFAQISKRALSKATFPVICPPCRFQKVSRSVQHGIKERSLPQAQAYSQGPEFQLPVSKASIYAISAKKEIPPQLQDLHSSLSALQNDATSYINLSQLRLALRGLESKRPITRIAGMLLNP